MEQKDLTVKNAQAIATEVLNEWGAPVVGAQDMVIPKILPMQGLSEMVTARKAQIGEFRDSLSSEKLGGIDEPLEVIPFFMQKAWDIQEADGKGNYKWARTVALIDNPADPGYNDNLPWEGEENGVSIKRIRRYNFFVLIRAQGGQGLPYVVSFKSTSLREGKKLLTEMYVRNIKAGLPPAAFSFMLGGHIDKNDKGTFMVPTMTRATKTTPEELAECLSWIKLINKGAVKVDEADVVTESVSADVAGTGDY